MTEHVASLSVRVGADTSEAKQKLKELDKIGDSFGKRISTAFESAAFSGQGFGEILRSLALDLSKLTLRAALLPMTSAIGDAFSGMFAFAKGGVLQGGAPVPQPFADGGVIASPITFPMSGGRMGLAGEAGPEAIMPLARGPDGRLGVRGGGSGGRPVAITFNISTPDAESFRRSEGQIAALLSRTVSRGQRNL
jgi:phage-related minor tail protein